MFLLYSCVFLRLRTRGPDCIENENLVMFIFEPRTRGPNLIETQKDSYISVLTKDQRTNVVSTLINVFITYMYLLLETEDQRTRLHRKLKTRFYLLLNQGPEDQLKRKPNPSCV